MITELILMNGYGLYVWLSFGIVLIACTILYARTKKTLKKYERIFLSELNSLPEERKQAVIKNSKFAKQILAASSGIN
tara:strand:+ start:38 stop:271 length:234 start_codon:yes stop_codon:yes gene_type:complete